MDVVLIWYVFLKPSPTMSNAIQLAFWIYVDAVNIATDLLITVFTLGILVHLQMPMGTKAMVVGVFGSRILYANLTPDYAIL
jgi:hypothetical protein